MPIAINGTGTITGISAGGLPDGVITTDDIAANAVTYAKIGTTEQGQLCKAWVNFNGTGTVAIRASYNVSSITDNGTGLYTVNFTTSLADTSYSVVLGSTSPVPFCGDDSVSRTTSLCQVRTADTTFALADYSYVQVAIFR